MSKIIIGERDSGKTTRVINIALSNLIKGKSVLIVAPTEGMTRNMFIRAQDYVRQIKELDINFLFNVSHKIIKIKDTDAYVEFIPEGIFKGPSYDPKKYRDFLKIYDESTFDKNDFDYIVVNGSLEEEYNEQ